MAGLPIIGTIKGKIDKLIADNVKLRGECRKLTEQRDRLRSDNRELMTKATELEKRIAILELTSGLATTGADRKQAKARVNHLMREVDKCISLLNR